jgi:drug/metabolite transporter (DMT)-like permease
MSHPPHRFRGPLFMVLATGSYVVNDTMMKLATEGLPPYEVLTLRGISASLWGILLLAALGQLGRMREVFSRWVLARNVFELAAILGYVVALAHMQIADVIALGQITPLIVLVGAALLYREPLGSVSVALIGLGFLGALMVVQPTAAGISVYALLGLSNAVFSAVRDIVGRRVPAQIPGMLVAFGASAVVMLGALAAHLLLEETVPPSPHHLLLLAAAGLFLFCGHYSIFASYRIGPTGMVAPFYYFFTFWALVSGLLVFGNLPNMLAIGGIVLVVASGLAIVLLDRRKYKPMPAA